MSSRCEHDVWIADVGTGNMIIVRCTECGKEL